MTILHFFKSFILNEVNYVIVRDQYEFFRRIGVGGIRGCAIVLVTGRYVVLENIITEYYTVRTPSSSFPFKG